jgi:hypothetical protein
MLNLAVHKVTSGKKSQIGTSTSKDSGLLGLHRASLEDGTTSLRNV